MTNRNDPVRFPNLGGALPFGDDGPGDELGDRLPSILAGNEKALAEATVNLVVRGGGLLIHGTKDGGAIGLHVFYGQVKQVRYAASPEALQALLEALSGWTPAQPIVKASTLNVVRQARR